MFNFRTCTEEEKVALEKVMQHSHAVFKKLADKKFRTIHSLRKDYFNGSLLLNDPLEKEAFEAVHRIEEDVIACYGKMALKIAKRYFVKERANKNVEFDDYAQEAIIALVGASYYYDGDKRFTTFATIVIQNKMREYIRDNCVLSKVKKRIVRLSSQIHKLMNMENLTFDAAAEKLQLSQKDLQEVMQSLVRCISDVKWDFSVSDVNFSNNANFDGTLVMQAMQEADLSDFERAVVDAKLNQRPIASVVDQFHRSRMAGTLALRRAYEIIKQKYDELSKAA